MHQNTPFYVKKIQKFSGEGPQTQTPGGGGHPGGASNSLAPALHETSVSTSLGIRQCVLVVQEYPDPAVTPAAAAAAAAAAEAEEQTGWLAAGHYKRSAAAAASCAAAAVREAAELVPVTPSPTRNCPPTPELTASAVRRCYGPLQASHAPKRQSNTSRKRTLKATFQRHVTQRNGSSASILRKPKNAAYFFPATLG